MDVQIWLDMRDFTSLSLRTCTCVKPVKNVLMAPSSRIFSWSRACGIRIKSALRSAFSTIAAALRIPKQRNACDNLARSILKKCDPEEIVQHSAQWRLVDAWPYGPLYVLEALWQRLGIADIIAEQLKGRKLDFAGRTRSLCHGGQPSLCALLQALLL